MLAILKNKNEDGTHCEEESQPDPVCCHDDHPGLPCILDLRTPDQSFGSTSSWYWVFVIRQS